MIRVLHPPARAAVVALLTATTALTACTVPRAPSEAPRDDRSTSGASSTPRTSGPATGTAPGAARARELLAVVRIVARRPDVPGYDRDCGPGDGCVFGTRWNDDTDAPDGRDGCDTRNDVLAAQLVDVRFSERSPGCDVVAGTLVDPYTGRTMDYATQGAQIHVDHLFPLAAAWDLGAAAWTPQRRARFANDTALELLAVEGAANQRKGDSTPASWLPPRKAFRCTYVTAYLEVAHAYDLAVTAADVRVIEPVLRTSC